MLYEDYVYLFPPRPTMAIAPQAIGFYERMKWCAQVKKNGTCTVIFARGMNVMFKTRHNDDHKQWDPLPEHLRPFQTSSLEYNVYIAELVHNKTKETKNLLYVFDQIVKDGVQLVGTSFADRQTMLHEQFKGTNEGDSTRVNEHVVVANCYHSGFSALWNSLSSEADEGLVFKDGNAKLKPCFKEGVNGVWQTKCRKQTKNFTF